MDKKKKEMILRAVKLRLMIVVMMLLVITVFLTFHIFFIAISDNYQTLVYGVQVQNHVNDNDLSMPFPSNPIVDDKLDYIDIMEQDLDNFHQDVKEYYYYDNDSYNCQYWAYVWLNWWKYNKDEYNLKIKTINTDNHIFVMVYNDSGYCMLDGNDKHCMMN